MHKEDIEKKKHEHRKNIDFGEGMMHIIRMMKAVEQEMKGMPFKAEKK